MKDTYVWRQGSVPNPCAQFGICFRSQNKLPAYFSNYINHD